MYEQHFGLKKRPFQAKATGSAVFVGPQTANIMAGLKKSLVPQDAVVTVSGPAGSGKTTLVARATAALSDTHKSVRIGRMHLAGTDALEFLLDELGVTEPPRGTIRQFQALRARLSQLESEGTRVVVLIEDAMRCGAETISEIEALTAADAGASGGAAIVLMGDDGLQAFCRDPQLARLEQRIRQRLQVSPLSAPELRGYLMHCFRLAGSDFEFLFDDRSAKLIHGLSGGIPRIANNIAEAALSSAALAGIQKISATQVADVAKEEFGLDMPELQDTAEAELEPVAESQVEPEPEILPELAREAEPEPVVASEPDPEASPAAGLTIPELPVMADIEPLPDPVIVFSNETSEEPLLESEDIPELIQDTLPDLEVLAPEIVATEAQPEPAAEIPELQPELEPQPEPLLETATEPALEESATGLEPELLDGPEFDAVLDAIPDLEPLPEPEPQPEPEPDPLPAPGPTLELEQELEQIAEASGEEIPAWDRDPTQAELRPDLDALEKAMAFAHGEPEGQASKEKSAAAAATAEEDEIPEIILDDAIQERIDSSRIENPDQPESDAPAAAAAADMNLDAPESENTTQAVSKANDELERIAAELAKAKTIEDVDDKLAETLFGEEINLIAAQVVANGTTSESANDEELTLFDTATANVAQSAGSGHTESIAPAPSEPDIEMTLETKSPTANSGLDMSASQRLKTVRALNADLHPSLREPGNDGPVKNANGAPANGSQPEPIEDQINTSITQTLKALKVKPPTADHNGEEEDAGKKSGFFSRFKRS